jgi:hypothetical protein
VHADDGAESVEYHRATVLECVDDHPGITLILGFFTP